MKNKFLDIKRYLREIKVGSFFFGALVLLFITLLSMRELSFFRKTQNLIVKFDFAEGLRSSSPVRFCGVDIGEVKEVEVRRKDADQPVVYVHIKVDKDSRIPRNSCFFINGLSLFGEKYLEILPPEKTEGYLQEGEIIDGNSPTPLFYVMNNVHKTMKEVNEFVKDGKVRKSFENTISNVEKISEDVKQLMEDVRNKKGTVGRLFYDESLYVKTEEFIEELKKNPWKLLHKPKDVR
ncbi:MAG: MlaD family protein [Candidatus Omnitrophota bacterium]|nr:MlaD family protein [Candidatus Omnitrophota bacterium]